MQTHVDPSFFDVLAHIFFFRQNYSLLSQSKQLSSCNNFSLWFYFLVNFSRDLFLVTFNPVTFFSLWLFSLYLFSVTLFQCCFFPWDFFLVTFFLVIFIPVTFFPYDFFSLWLYFLDLSSCDFFSSDKFRVNWIRFVDFIALTGKLTNERADERMP